MSVHKGNNDLLQVMDITEERANKITESIDRLLRQGVPVSLILIKMVPKLKSRNEAAFLMYAIGNCLGKASVDPLLQVKSGEYCMN